MGGYPGISNPKPRKVKPNKKPGAQRPDGCALTAFALLAGVAATVGGTGWALFETVKAVL